MTYSKPIAVALATVVCATVSAADAGAQSRGRAPGGGPTVGRAVPGMVVKIVDAAGGKGHGGRRQCGATPR